MRDYASEGLEALAELGPVVPTRAATPEDHQLWSETLREFDERVRATYPSKGKAVQ